MGKNKKVLLDNGKAARSSMALYWKAAQNKNKKKNKTEKKEVPEEDIEGRADNNHDKWKTHKEKLINKLYAKDDKKEKIDREAEEQRDLKEEAEMDKQLVEKEMNKNKPVSIPGFKNSSQIHSKMQFENVHVGHSDSNKLIPRSAAEELTQEDIIQILREKKAKKELAKLQKDRVDSNLRDRKVQEDMIGFAQDKKHRLEPEQKPDQQSEEVEPEPENFFKSQILQKIERGEGVHTKDQRVVGQQLSKEEPKEFIPRFIPRALWEK